MNLFDMLQIWMSYIYFLLLYHDFVNNCMFEWEINIMIGLIMYQFKMIRIKNFLKSVNTLKHIHYIYKHINYTYCSMSSLTWKVRMKKRANAMYMMRKTVIRWPVIPIVKRMLATTHIQYLVRNPRTIWPVFCTNWLVLVWDSAPMAAR